DSIVLELEGMHCASCAARVEKALNRLDGVDATVNLATERATAVCAPSVSADDLVAAVESTGYHARPVMRSAPHEHSGGHDHDHDAPPSVLERRLAVAVALTVPTALLAMVPPLEFRGWEWVALVLSTPVVLWSGLDFHRAALNAARHGSASMDTLVSIGTLAAWGWSTVVLVAGLDA